ncbi:major facilitator superfamily domain-containing protein [Melampsora americana]|nr:major facilitator superfamily domain-containing protein [Melampsora americana]
MTQLAVNAISPSIQADLSIDSTNIQMISNSFALANGSTLLLAGRLADIYGHKKCLLAGLAVFAAFSIASATASSVTTLAIYRAIQGVGASAIAPALLGIIARTFAKGSKMRTEGFASFSAGSPLGASIGLLVGDWMTETTGPGWRSFFYFIAAFSALTYVLSFFFLPPDLPRDKDQGYKNVDWIGAALLTSGLVLLVISLVFFPRFGWNSAAMLAPLGCALLMLSGFIAWENHMDQKGARVPLVPITLLIVGLALNLVTGHLADILPAQLMIMIGCVATLTCCILSAFMDPHAIYWKFNFASIILSVIGADFMFSVVAMFGSKIASDDEQAIAGAVLLSFTRIFSVIGLGVATIAQAPAPRQAYWDGLQAAFIVFLASSLLATLLSLAFLQGMGYVGAHHKNLHGLEKTQTAELEAAEEESIPN